MTFRLDPFKISLWIIFMLHPLSVANSSALSLKAIYYGIPPLVIPPKEGGTRNGTRGSVPTAPTGHIPDMITDAFVQLCFPLGSAISEWKNGFSPRGVHESRDGYDILFPVTRTSAMATMLQANPLYRFIPFVESPGVSILRDTSDGSSAIAMSLLGTWPLGLALILTAVFAGIIIWLLESRWNPDGFPRPFAKGLWEGVWWAWVTMSTVGYGDKTPMTIAGRVFAYLWILVGIIFMSIFTATVTTAIGTDSSSITSINGHKVGVINGGTEEWLALSRGAEVTVYDGRKDMLTALKNGTLDAILLDSVVVISASTEMEELNIVSVGTISAETLHGALLFNMSAETAQCFMQLIDFYTYEIVDAIKGVSRTFHKRSVEAATASMFVGDNMDWIYIMVGVVLGLIIFFLSGECIYRIYLRTKVEPDEVQKISLENV